MSNYCVTGSLDRAALELDRAISTLSFAPRGSEDEALCVRLVALLSSIERASKRARKLIPGGWKPASSIVPTADLHRS